MVTSWNKTKPQSTPRFLKTQRSPFSRNRGNKKRKLLAITWAIEPNIIGHLTFRCTSCEKDCIDFTYSSFDLFPHNLFHLDPI